MFVKCFLWSWPPGVDSGAIILNKRERLQIFGVQSFLQDPSTAGLLYSIMCMLIPVLLQFFSHWSPFSMEDFGQREEKCVWDWIGSCKWALKALLISVRVFYTRATFRSLSPTSWGVGGGGGVLIQRGIECNINILCPPSHSQPPKLPDTEGESLVSDCL